MPRFFFDIFPSPSATCSFLVWFPFLISSYFSIFSYKIPGIIHMTVAVYDALFVQNFAVGEKCWDRRWNDEFLRESEMRRSWKIQEFPWNRPVIKTEQRFFVYKPENGPGEWFIRLNVFCASIRILNSTNNQQLSQGISQSRNVSRRFLLRYRNFSRISKFLAVKSTLPTIWICTF